MKAPAVPVKDCSTPELKKRETEREREGDSEGGRLRTREKEV